MSGTVGSTERRMIHFGGLVRVPEEITSETGLRTLVGWRGRERIIKRLGKTFQAEVKAMEMWKLLANFPWKFGKRKALSELRQGNVVTSGLGCLCSGWGLRVRVYGYFSSEKILIFKGNPSLTRPQKKIPSRPPPWLPQSSEQALPT